MKNTTNLFGLVFSAIILLSSCGGGNGISEVKLIPVKNGKDFQYIDRDGKIVINPQFSEASIFRDGLALVKTSGDEPKWGFIDEKGQYQINAQYKKATIFNEGLAWVVNENSAPTAIDKKGEIKFSLQNAEDVKIFHNGLAAFSEINEEGERKWGFVDTKGTVAINPQFTNVTKFSDGKCGVRNSENKWGFIDKTGKLIINHQFDSVKDFVNGKCVVSFDQKFGVIDKDGKYSINPQFNNIEIDGNIFLINQDSKWGWCDKDGKMIINPQFSVAFPFLNNKIAAVQSGDKYGYIDKEGKITINPQFDMAMPFNGNLALVASSNKIGFIGKDGKYMINPQFDNVSEDFVIYKISGKSVYESVSTDYFNLVAITNILNFKNPEGFSLSSTFADIMKKNNLVESDFGKYVTDHSVISHKKITNDATYNFYVSGSPYDNVIVNRNNGYYTYQTTERHFNSSNVITGFAYRINLQGKGYGKEDIVFKGIQNALSGFTKDEQRSSDDDLVFKNDSIEVRVKSNLYIIVKKIKENEDINEQPTTNELDEEVWEEDYEDEDYDY